MEITTEILSNFRIPSMSEEDLQQAKLTYERVYGLDIMCVGADMQRLLVNFQKEGSATAMMDLILLLKERQEARKELVAKPEIYTDYEDNREFNF